jgi:hypothetical protein
VALDQEYIDQEAFEKIYHQAGKVSKLNSGPITYLLQNQERYKKNASP